jgi:hypothetical protein
LPWNRIIPTTNKEMASNPSTSAAGRTGFIFRFLVGISHSISYPRPSGSFLRFFTCSADFQVIFPVRLGYQEIVKLLACINKLDNPAGWKPW